jgi:ketosteroid isomerase-like protein
MPNTAREMNVVPSAVDHAGADDLETLQQINSSYMRSVQTSDVRWFDENLAEDFMNSNPDGSLVDRAAFLAQIATPCVVSNFGAEDVRIRILGEIAIIHGRTVYTKADGHAGAGRYTDVYSRRSGRWLCVSAHVTRG